MTNPTDQTIYVAMLSIVTMANSAAPDSNTVLTLSNGVTVAVTETIEEIIAVGANPFTSAEPGAFLTLTLPPSASTVPETCPICDGARTVEKRWPGGMVRAVPCEACRGTGKTPAGEPE